MGNITFRTDSSNDPSYPRKEELKVRVFPKFLGRPLSRLGLAALHQTAEGENIWVSTKEIYSHVITSLKKGEISVDEKKVERLFNRHLHAKKGGEPPKIPDIIRDIIRDYRSGQDT